MPELLPGLPTHDLARLALAVAGVWLLVRIFRQTERPSSSIAWLLAIVFVPQAGIPAYLLFGGRKLRRLARRKALMYRPHRTAAELNPVERVLASHGLHPAREGNRVILLADGTQTWRALLRGIDEAQHTIEIATFIFGVDRIGRDVAERLVRRAREGVTVRVLVDGFGSLRARLGLLRQLERGGVRTGVFQRIWPPHRRWSANLRNHRKLALFDRRRALVGGMNIAREYLGEPPYGARWIDTMSAIEGPAVADLAEVFAGDWEFATGERLALDAAAPVSAAGDQHLQLAVSGPDIDGDPLSDALLAAVYHAARRVWIATPYFIPDEGLLRALSMQARAGVDVRLVLPQSSNHPVADFARGRFLRELHARGVRVFLHPERMMHAKHLLVDDTIAVAGSANLDLRSLYLNYELAVFGYGGRMVVDTEAWLEALIAECREAPLPTRGWLGRWGEDLGWLVSPLL